MSCKNCLKDDSDIFEYKCNIFKDRHSLALFLSKHSYEHSKKIGSSTVAAMEIQSAWFAKQTFIIKNMNMFYVKTV